MRSGDPYFDWLCILTGGKTAHVGYSELLDCLHEKVFRPKMAMDINRGNDGLQLRVDFQNEHGPWGSSTNRGPCSYLELLIGLAKRMSFLMHGEENGYTEFYFWRLIANLDLIKCTDTRWNSMNGEFFVDDAVYRINERCFCADGSGGLFPLRRYERDQRGVEFWYQMQAWLMENSDIGEL